MPSTHCEASTLPAGMITLVLLCFTVGCSKAAITNAIAQLSQQINADSTASPNARSRSTRTKPLTPPTLPHGTTCTCPTIVSGTSYGCWEAL